MRICTSRPQVMGSSADGPLLCLVYDFMEGGSLETRLNLSNPNHNASSVVDSDRGGGPARRHATAGCEAGPSRQGTCPSGGSAGSGGGGGGMSWEQRVAVALDVARGIEFLHRPQPPYHHALVRDDSMGFEVVVMDT